ncbi:MAG: alanine racemase [Clostridiales bacterium]|nr:alanine racemase [Clostridiales bacterium]
MVHMTDERFSRCWAEIDAERLRENYRSARRRAGGARVICVLKGNAYGLGAAEACRALKQAGADMFAVASGGEAEALLGVFPGTDVLVLGLVGAVQAARLIGMGAVFTLFSRHYGDMLADAAQRAGRPARVHIKAETGLMRLGLTDAAELDGLLPSPHLRVEGLFTHLALHDRTADEAQFSALDRFAEALGARGIAPGMVHALDSIGLVRYPERAMDAVRVGAWLYGVRPRGCPEDQARPVVTLKTRVAQLHAARKGARVGYDDDHFLSRDSVIATLSAGYADGVPRYKNTGAVVIRGRRAPVRGLVCMDQMMVDVTDIPDVREGDAATLLGDSIDIEEYAAWGGMNHNEALARLGTRVERVWREE